MARLGEALTTLARYSQLLCHQGETPKLSGGLEHAEPDRIGAWLAATALRLGLETEAVTVPYTDVERLLRGGSPALLWLPGNDSPGVLLLVASRRQRVAFLGPDLVQRWVAIATVRAALCQEAEAPYREEIDRLLATATVPRRRQARARRAILGERLCDQPLHGGWLLRLPAGSSFWQQLRQAGLHRRLGGLLATSTTQYLLWLLSWWLLGQGALQGRLDHPWLLASGLLLLTLIPLRLLSTWLQGSLAFGLGGLLKSRLLAGALRLQPEEVRHQGAGQFLGQVLESDTVEALALSGG